MATTASGTRSRRSARPRRTQASWTGSVERRRRTSACLEEYDDRIVSLTAAAAQVWGDRDARRPTPVADGLIAATAAVHGWTLVTRNTKDVEHLDILLLNPFTG